MDERWRIKTNWISKDDLAVQNAIYVADCQVKTRKQTVRAMEKNKQIQKKQKEWKKETIADFTDWTYGCMALALHRMHGWGAKRISKFLEFLEVTRAELIDQGLYSYQIWDIVRKEIKLDVSVVDGFEWKEENDDE